MDKLIELLTRHEIDAVVDTRSSPFSRYAPQYNQPALARELPLRGMKYVFCGDELGGRPHGVEFYDEEGYVLYWKVAESDFFLKGIARIERAIRTHRIALMCSEENPDGCHRRLLIGRVLRSRGISVCHIRGNGTLQREDDLLAAESGSPEGGQQLALFQQAEVQDWKSLRSVSPRSQRASSSGH